MTSVCKRQRAKLYIYNKKLKKRNVLNTKYQPLRKKQDNFRYVFVQKSLDNLRSAIFHEKLEVGIYIKKP